LVAQSFQIPLDAVTAETDLRDLNDSLGMVELTMALEELGLELPPGAVERFERSSMTVGELAAMIEDQRK
jgi:acyl carrier protein